ncbi:MAG: M28 family peptidase [Leptolyngbya sp. SIO4C1]|nr:M28 family peptidase [Leptolyngbya sp. SIO4C1]
MKKAWQLITAAILAMLIGGGCLSLAQLVDNQRTAAPLTVETARLRSHLQALSYERYAEPDRDTARTYLIETLSTYGYEPAVQPFDGRNGRGVNLIATRPGTGVGTLLVGAHYDTVEETPGADDNASAVAATLELARLFANISTRRTVQFVLFDQEEVGLQGSSAFVANSENLANLQGAVILEMIGYTCAEPGCQQYPPGLPPGLPARGTFLGVIGDMEHLALLQAFQQQTAALQVLTLPVAAAAIAAQPDLFRSDHVPFWQSGIGAVMVTDTADFRNPHYHQPSDRIDSLDLPFLTTVTQHVANTVQSLLDLP